MSDGLSFPQHWRSSEMKPGLEKGMSLAAPLQGASKQAQVSRHR